MESKAQLRRNIREQRRNLDPQTQQQAAQTIFDFISPLSLFTDSQHIAAYLASDGEIDPHLLVKLAWEQGKSCYLPILDGDGLNQLKFARYTPETQFINNRYNIPEPINNPEDLHDASILDLVLTPLVAFDNQGNRMGMGKGFYDRTFEFVRKTPSLKKPLLIGLAHSCQQVDYLEPAEWDVPLNGVATDEQLSLF